MNTDHNLWKVIQNGNNKKSLERDSKGGIIILPPISFKEHVVVQRETKVRTLLLQSLPEDHMADFHHLDDAREIWLAMKARFGGNEESKKMRKTMLEQEFSEFRVSEEEGLHKGYDRFQKILSQLNQMQAKPDNDDMAMLSLRINKFQKKTGRKINFNNKDSARFDRRKARCYNCLQLGYFTRECNVKKVDEKARYSAFKISEVKTEEPKAMVSVDSMLNWNEHDAENKTEEAEQVYGLMAGFESDFAVPASNAVGGEWEVKFVESLARFDKWKESSKNQLLNSSMSTKTKLGIGFKKYIGSDEVCDLSTPSVFGLEPVNREVKSLYERFVKAGNMHEVPPPITGTFMPTSYQSDLAETQETFGSKSNTSSIPTSEFNDFVSCNNSDKSSASETYDFASCVSSPKANDSFSTVDVKILPKSDVKDPSPTNGFFDCSFKENVKSTRNICNKSGTADRIHCKNNFVRSKKCFVYVSKSYLIKDCHMYDTVDNFSSVVLKAASVPAGSRNSSASTTADRSIPTASRDRSASIHAGRFIPAASRNRPASIHAGRHIPAGRDDGVLLLSPRQVVLGEITDLTCNGVPRIMVHPHMNKDIDIVDSGCSISMTGNKEKLADFVQVKGGTVTFGGGDGKITGKGTIRTFKLDFENVYYVEELQNFNLFSVSQICDKKNKPEQHINYLLAKASLEESTKWHIRMAHVNFKIINKLAKLGFVEGLPLKLFTNEHNCVACNKEKQHKAFYKAVSAVRTISEPLQLLHMDLFGPTSIRKAVSTACYVLNKVCITNPHNKTPYELLSGKIPNI
nr:ribonuclease H-like domain-containing protein [Tanacetum cinerariifolium]